jgi:hypothetical protein
VSQPRARASIVGGNQIEISQAPWQVFVVGVIPISEDEALFLFCGGSIIDETHIVTAGHCMFDPETGSRLPAENVFAVAGTSNVAKVETGEQEVKAATVRVHPDFEYEADPGTTDDVAILELSDPLTFNTLVQPIGLVAAGATPAEGTQVNLTGFGRETPTGKEEGPLHSLGMTVGFSRSCGGPADAIFLCASAAGGSGCEGDSGSALTSGATPVLVGVMDTVTVISGEGCGASSDNGFVNVAAPEIRDFIEGEEDPPIAPRGGGISIRAITRVGHVATCESGSWSGSPTFAYRFLNSANDQALQSGPSATYQLTAVDVGLSISCEVLASNAGGTGVSRTNALPSIASAEEPAPGPGPPYETKLSPGAIESGNEAAARTLKEWEAAQGAQEHKKQEELEGVERARRELEAQKAEKTHVSARRCVVPSLKGDSLSKATHALSKAHCKLGKVTVPHGRHDGRLVVTRQRPNPGEKLAANTRVSVSMGPASAHRK